MKNLCVYCGSSDRVDKVYKDAARAMAQALVKRKMRLIYGGGNVGLMGVVAETALQHGADVIGVIPQSLMSRELGHDGVTELRIVNSMHERKQMMADLADGFIAMPGGIGTLEELFEILTWSQLSFHHKPVGLLNVDSYFDDLLNFLNKMVKKQFMSQTHLDLLTVDEDAENLLNRLDQ